MEEREAAPLFVSLDILCCQTVIFLENLRKIRLFDRVGLFIRCYDRLNRHFLESKIGKMQDIFAKIQVVVCEGTTHEIIAVSALLCKFLELRHDQVVASGSVAEWAHLVVDLFSSIQTEHDVCHLAVAEFHNFIV